LECGNSFAAFVSLFSWQRTRREAGQTKAAEKHRRTPNQTSSWRGRFAVDSQTILVCLTAVAALAYLARSAWRTWARKTCGSGCGSCGSSAVKKDEGKLIPADDLLMRVRQGNGDGRGCTSGNQR
jgi:hypothetical protein